MHSVPQQGCIFCQTVVYVEITRRRETANIQTIAGFDVLTWGERSRFIILFFFQTKANTTRSGSVHHKARPDPATKAANPGRMKVPLTALAAPVEAGDEALVVAAPVGVEVPVVWTASVLDDEEVPVGLPVGAAVDEADEDEDEDDTLRVTPHIFSTSDTAGLSNGLLCSSGSHDCHILSMCSLFRVQGQRVLARS